MLIYNGKLKNTSRALRKNMTDAEMRLWLVMRTRRLEGFPFSRQKITGPYIVDFYCHRARLVIEVDGGQHYASEGQRADRVRDEYLKSTGLTVLRFSARDVLNNTEGVVESILHMLKGSEEKNPLASPFTKGDK